MKRFMDADFLLTNATAKKLYHDYAKDMPIIDYHCHVDPSEIAQNRRFKNITQLWLGGDHYKWRLMRSDGIDEKYISGDADDREKFQKYAEALPKAPGHPLYHWSHLELQRYFDCDLPLNGNTAEAIWRITAEKLAALSVRDIIARSKVKVIATTDDPVDALEWHSQIKNDSDCKVAVVPCFRPDKAVNIEKPGFQAYINELSAATNLEIASLDHLFDALRQRLDFFGRMGCRSSDHGLDSVVFRPGKQNAADVIFKKGMAGQSIDPDEIEIYKTAIMLFFGREYARRGWVMQLHYGALRDANTAMFRKLGPDTGFDCINLSSGNLGIAGFLDALEQTNELPKTILYSLNPSENAMLDSVIGCFQGTTAAGKIQHGSAWWFNDTKDGMEAHLRSLANQSVLGNFVGMLTDSRSFLSYTRHEYFRRILCNLLGGWVENGEYPDDISTLGKMVQNISFYNTARYFGFDMN